MSSTCHLRPSCRWRGSEDLTVCCQAGTAEEALSEIPKCSPDLVITDMTMPGRGGLEFIKDVKAICPNLPVLVVSMHDEMLHAERALRAGARGYLMKEVDGEKMLEAIRKVLTGQVYVSEKMSARILDNLSGRKPRGSTSPIEKLSDREFEVFQLIGQGKSTREIVRLITSQAKIICLVCNARMAISAQLAQAILVEPLFVLKA